MNTSTLEQEIEERFKQLQNHKVTYDKTKLNDWLTDVSYLICENIACPTEAYNYRLQEQKRILDRTLFAVKQLYERPCYNGVNLDVVVDKISPKYMAARITRGDDNPFNCFYRGRR